MKCVAKLKTMGDVVLVQPNSKQVKLDKLLEDTDYIVNFEKLTNKTVRTINQNKYMWEIINQICIKEDGNRVRSYETYNNILQMAGTPYEDYYILQEALNTFIKHYNHVKVMGSELIQGTVYIHVRAFKGISEMDTKEASQLIDKVKEYAHQVGVKFDEDYWESLVEHL